MSKPVRRESDLEIETGRPGCEDEYFRELCALSATGTLSPAEWHRLDSHLSGCAACRAIAAEYDRVVSTALPAMASSRTSVDDGYSPEPWSMAKAEAALFERIEREDIKPDKPILSIVSKPHYRLSRFTGIAALVISSCSLMGYHLGVLHTRQLANLPKIAEQVTTPPQQHPSREVAAFSNAQQNEQARITERAIQLEHLLAIEGSRLHIYDDQRKSLLDQLAKRDSELNQEQARENDFAHQLALAQDDVRTLRAALDQRTNQLALANTPSSVALQKRVDLLADELAEKTQEVAKQAELLEHDHDIRNLMGARDLYIGEIYDVAKSGRTQKPFGRVFYTQGKSLVFYAYDLDRQPGVKLASTFQAWGRRSLDQQHDMSLGVFYQDDQNNERWILKSNDSAMLSKLDAVFVTIEPHGESSRPTGKPLLFTYLRLAPNHP